MRSYLLLVAGGLALAAVVNERQARAQFQAPPNSLALEDEKGTFEGSQDGLIHYRDSKTEAWRLHISPETKITVEGEAEEECLRSGAFVALEGQIDKKGMLDTPVTQIQIISCPDKSSLGLFSPGKDDEDAKPVRNAGAGKYKIRGRLAVFKDGELVVMAGSRRISGDIAEKLSVTLNIDDASVAQQGDEVSVKAWYLDRSRPIAATGKPGDAWAEEITIKLAKPLTYAGKKARAGEKPAKSTTKTRSTTKS